MKGLKNPARPFYQSVPKLEETIISSEDSEVEDYYRKIFPHSKKLSDSLKYYFQLSGL